MLNYLDFEKLRRYGITEHFISHFNNEINNFIENTAIKKVVSQTILFSDLHANLQAFEIMLRFAKEHGIDSFISLGDLIEYNNQNNEVLELILSNSYKFVSNLRGNHDEGIINGDEFVSNLFQDHIKKDLGQVLFTLSNNDVININGKKILLCHSNPWNADILYLFPEMENFLDYFLEFLNCDGFFFGHTHFVTFYKSISNSKIAFNPGSLGVSRDGNKTLHFSVLKPIEQKIELYELLHFEEHFTKILSETPIKIDEFQL